MAGNQNSALEKIGVVEQLFNAAVDEAQNVPEIEQVKVLYTGKKSELSLLMRTLGEMDPIERASVGPELNKAKLRMIARLGSKIREIENAALDARLATERADVTLPVRPEPRGKLHPVTQVMEELAVIFSDMGFTVAEGPDVEDDFHNFTALNFPEGHPARDTHDTFFMKARADGSQMVLRTHTSPVQIRTMMTQKPPIRIIAPGRVYRCDWDQTHTPMFHQVEGLVIDKGAHMGHLKGILMDFLAAFFETDTVEAQFRPHHFPFTEPSAEMDVRYSRVGDAVKIGEGDSWMEILGCGMVHPNVIRSCGLDPDEYQGFAWGMGVDRLAMLKYGAPDLRDYFANDTRWLAHYGFSPLLQANLATGLS